MNRTTIENALAWSTERAEECRKVWHSNAADAVKAVAYRNLQRYEQNIHKLQQALEQII